ncbi:MAG: SIR2 family protein [Bacteroidia bacterium]
MLLIGPEILQSEGESLHKRLQDALKKRNQQDIAYFYERDGFYLFSSPESKVRVAREVKRFYKRATPDEAIFKQIAQIPFSLIVSVNPDTFLSEAFYRYGIKHRFHYFQHNHRSNENEGIDKPSIKMPLIYNIFGSKDQDDSLILDYDDMYKMLESALGSSSLPPKFLRSFRNARTYIFLGFRFDVWYSQFLLKYLSGNAAKDQMIAVKSDLNNVDTQGFIVQQFKVEFMGKDDDFWGELFRQCDDRDMLRKIVEETTPEAVKIHKRVANGELHEALEILQEGFRGKSEANEIILLQSQWNRLEDEKEKMDSRDYNPQRNRLIDSILELTKDL